MNSGAFVRDLSTFVANLNSLIEAGKDLVNSEIYENRLRRCLFRTRNKAALADFLVLDNILLAAVAVAEKHTAQDVRELREKVVDASVKYVKKEIEQGHSTRPFDQGMEQYLRSRSAPMDDRARKILKKRLPGRSLSFG